MVPLALVINTTITLLMIDDCMVSGVWQVQAFFQWSFYDTYAFKLTYTYDMGCGGFGSKFLEAFKSSVKLSLVSL